MVERPRRFQEPLPLARQPTGSHYSSRVKYILYSGIRWYWLCRCGTRALPVGVSDWTYLPTYLPIRICVRQQKQKRRRRGPHAPARWTKQPLLDTARQSATPVSEPERTPPTAGVALLRLTVSSLIELLSPGGAQFSLGLM